MYGAGGVAQAIENLPRTVKPYPQYCQKIKKKKKANQLDVWTG
jgi:hypothetical protein